MGGTNSHIILDDAFHFLQEQGLHGFHHCDTSPRGHPGKTIDSGPATNGHVTNGISTNGTSANGTSAGLQAWRLLICSAADAGATNRMLQAYQTYYQAHIANESRKLDQLALTLGRRRSIMPWRTFAVVNRVHGNSGQHQLSFAAPIHASSEKSSIGLVFTGQGAQYAGMGLELMQYPVFESSLRQSDEIFAGLGAGWSVFGKPLHRPHSLEQPYGLWSKHMRNESNMEIITDNLKLQMHFATMNTFIFPSSASHCVQRCRSLSSTCSAASASPLLEWLATQAERSLALIPSVPCPSGRPVRWHISEGSWLGSWLPLPLIQAP